MIFDLKKLQADYYYFFKNKEPCADAQGLLQHNYNKKH
jgi:hypothetical protein